MTFRRALVLLPALTLTLAIAVTSSAGAAPHLQSARLKRR